MKKKRNNIKIKNFGPIKEADLNIAPLTIFVGKNSSGKSFAAKITNILLNSFHDSPYSDDQYSDALFKFVNSSLNSFIKEHEEVYTEFTDMLWDYFKNKHLFREM